MRSRPRGLALALPPLLVATACGPGLGLATGNGDTSPSVPPRTMKLVDLTFDDVAPGGDVLDSQNRGSAVVSLVPVVDASGRITAEADASGEGTVLRFPKHAAEGTAPLAVLAVVPREAGDPLSPGEDDFAFGADFMLDELSEGTATDDGNNLVQRGLFDDPGQYKVQIDQGRVTCRVAGTAGDRIVAAAEPVEPGLWYRVSCERTGRTLTLSLTGLKDGVERSWSEDGATGRVNMSRPGSPLTVGGKVLPGPVVSRQSSDQFNGRIDNVWMQVTR